MSTFVPSLFLAIDHQRIRRSSRFWRKVTTCKKILLPLSGGDRSSHLISPLVAFTDSAFAALVYLSLLILFVRQNELSQTPLGISRLSRWTFLAQGAADSISFVGVRSYILNSCFGLRRSGKLIWFFGHTHTAYHLWSAGRRRAFDVTCCARVLGVRVDDLRGGKFVDYYLFHTDEGLMRPLRSTCPSLYIKSRRRKTTFLQHQPRVLRLQLPLHLRSRHPRKGMQRLVLHKHKHRHRHLQQQQRQPHLSNQAAFQEYSRPYERTHKPVSVRRSRSIPLPRPN